MCNEKVCTKCRITKSLDDFHKHKPSKDGKKPQCKDCRSKELKKYYKNNSDKKKAFTRNYAQNNREKVLQDKKDYNQKHKIRLNERKKVRNRIRAVTDLQFKLKRNLRNRLLQALKGNAKAGSAVKDLGCSITEFKSYIESLWLPGMDWNNHGRAAASKGYEVWHIDHIIPLSSFDLTDREQLLKACHYTNLQPLWSEDNLKKGDKLPK